MNKRIRPEIVSRLLSVSAAFLLGMGASASAATCSPNLDKSQVAQAEAYLSENRPKDAFALMYPLTQQGSGGAHQYLANMYEQGRGVQKSPFMVRHLNWMGSQYDDPESMYRAAQDFYARGYRKDGYYLASKAVDCGHPGAVILLLERAILEGREADARKYLEMGIDAGIPAAKFALAEQYDKGGLGLPKEPQRAFYWYTESAKHGEPKAMAAIAYSFFVGSHGVKDEMAAIHWYHKAARAGHVESMTAYGWMLANGRGAQVDKAEATHYLQKAKAAGNLAAAKFIAEIKQNHKSASVMQKESNGNLL